MLEFSPKPISLKELASRLDLSQSTVSRVVNGGGAAHRIAKETQDRVLTAAAQCGYAANAVAKSLRQKRTYTIGVIVPEISEGYSTAVLSGIEDELLKDGYFYFVVSHRHREDLLTAYPRMMVARAVEGIIAVDTPLDQQLPVPTVAVSGQRRHEGVVNIELHHEQAARLALEHLKELGHTRIAFIKGQPFSSDTDRRWRAIVAAAVEIGVEIDPGLVIQMDSPEPGPAHGSEVTRKLISSGKSFSAIFAFNDISAVGAMLALREAGLRVPQDVSVVGFDDVLLATTSNPPLTTIHQPLRTMGQAAASTLLSIIRNNGSETRPPVITVFPRLVVRESTGPAALTPAALPAM